MAELVIEPMVRIGPVRIGMSLAENRTVIGEPKERFQKTEQSVSLTDSYENLGLHVYYDENGSVEFIESFPVDGIRHFLYDISVFEVPAKDVVAKLASKGHGTSREGGSSLVYVSLGLSLWRSHSSNERFETVAVGKSAYFNKLNA